MDLGKLPPQHWHCSVELVENDRSAKEVVNDLDLERLLKDIVKPWHAGRAFSIGGTVVRRKDQVSRIKITQTEQSMAWYYSRSHVRNQNSSVLVLTDTRYEPLSEGTDYTNELLFAELKPELPSVDEQLIIQICQRLPAAARILSNRRVNKLAFKLEDEYDVQDFLHALIRAYVKFSVQEDPIGKIAGTKSKSSRADISIEEIGVLIEVKFVRSPDDQKEFVKQFSEDLVLYTKWVPLKTLLYVVYNSNDLHDPEALLKLDGEHKVTGKVFCSKMILI